ncbi:hypothetical protein H2198_002985 [Neophaeococcomyces mojaviensis]|uniref:Uncharacterized protein n=1 Tax=Neophaeococcomyces mojaviensis TaxID=3383035 RepID=A0ACC3AD64_9EURO|nr:hypothetical protein H2198_002985 [Knufia sp. JES_112]
MTRINLSHNHAFQNPILPGFNPDPSIVRVGSDYFCVTSSFEYTPGAPIYHSTDLVRWRLIGHALTRPSQLVIKTVEPGGGVWATTIRHHDGVFYITTCCFDRYRPQLDDRVFPRGFYVRTSNIWDSSSWSDPIYFDLPGFDQDLFWDDDGTVYLSVTRRKVDRCSNSKLKDLAIHVSTIDLESGSSTSPALLIRESPTGISEGSHHFKRGNYYYLFTAEGGTEAEHCEWVMRSSTGPFGPYEVGPRNPLLRNTTMDEIQSTGHCDLLEDNQGRWWAVCLGVRPVQTKAGFKPSVFGRESFLMPVTWEDDWPVLNGNRPVALEFEDKDLYRLELPSKWLDKFDNNEMQLGWYRKNTPIKCDYVLDTKLSCLKLYGGPYDLSSRATPTLFLRKQTHRPVLWSTQLSFQPTSHRYEAGTVVWWNHDTYCSIGIRSTRNAQHLPYIRVRMPDGTTTEVPLTSTDADVELFIDCQLCSYRLGFRELVSSIQAEDEKDESTTWVAEVSTETMTREPRLGAPFTGMMLGLYAFGDMEKCLTPAVFKYASFT